MAPSGSCNTQLVQRTLVAELLQQPVAVGALGHRSADGGVAVLLRGALHPAGQGGADAAATVLREHAGLAPVGTDQLAERDQPVSVVHAHGHRGEVEAGPLPVGLEVGRLDVDATDVVLLLGRRDGEDGVEVSRRCTARPSGRREDPCAH